MPDVVYVTSDLMFSSRVSGAAQRANVRLQTVPKWPVSEAMVTGEEPTPRLVILDLSTPGLDVAAAVAAWRGVELPPRIVAYAPHVHEGKLSAARAAQCDAVYTKGQFDAQVEEILASARDA